MTPQDFTVGQRVMVNVDPKPTPGWVVKIGRTFVWVILDGAVERRACFPEELDGHHSADEH